MHLNLSTVCTILFVIIILHDIYTFAQQCVYSMYTYYVLWNCDCDQYKNKKNIFLGI